MVPVGQMSSASSVCSNVSGIAGNLFAFVLFASPIPTFRRIVKNRSTEQFSESPYVYALLNCLICMWYGSPFVTPGVILVATVNSIGAVFQLGYLTIFILYADRAKKLKTFVLLLLVLALFLTVVFMSMRLFSPGYRQIFVGYLSVISLISMFASPFLVIKLVVKTKSVEYMPFCLSLSTFLMSVSFFAYGTFKSDPFIYVPNGIGTVLGVGQLLLYFYYKRLSAEEDCREPLLHTYA